MSDPQSEILTLTRRLLEAIAAADWPAYEALCATDLTAFEPEARGHRVEGLDFHRFYFDAGLAEGNRLTTMVDPKVVLLGADAALITYVRLVQGQTPQGPLTQRCEETRIWQRRDGHWLHVHFHRSDNS